METITLRFNVAVIPVGIILLGGSYGGLNTQQWKEHLMSEILYRSKSTEWIRALFGGSLSALVVGIALFLFTFISNKETLFLDLLFFLYVALDLPGIFLHTWLLGDPFAKLLPPAEAAAIGWRVILLSVVYWFLSGFALTYFIKNNRKAVMVWLLTIVILAVLAFFLNFF